MVTAMVGCAMGAREGPKGRVPVGVPVCPLVWAGEPCLFSGGVGGAGQHLGRTAGVSPCHTAGGAGGVVALTQGLFWGEGCWWGLWKGLHKNEQGLGGNLMGWHSLLGINPGFMALPAPS